MTRNLSRNARLISLLVAASLLAAAVPTRGQDDAERARRRDLARRNRAQAQRIENAADTGIFVDTPKIYDDFSLHLMLNAARARLAALQTFDQTGLLNRIGAITGATLQQTAVSAQVLGPPVPSATVASLGATGSAPDRISTRRACSIGSARSRARHSSRRPSRRRCSARPSLPRQSPRSARPAARPIGSRPDGPAQ